MLGSGTVLLACGETNSPAAPTKTVRVTPPASLAPTRPTRYVWRSSANSSRRPRIQWLRVKLSPGNKTKGYRYVQGICAKLQSSPRPYCAGGICKQDQCTLKNGESIRYGFLPAARAPMMRLSWTGNLTLSQPGPDEGRIKIPAGYFQGAVTLAREN